MSMALSLQEKVTVSPHDYHKKNPNMAQTMPKKNRMNIDIIQENENESDVNSPVKDPDISIGNS